MLTLARLGVGRFNLADFDSFEIQNFNRQSGATMATIGRPKIEVMTEMAKAINRAAEHCLRRTAGIGCRRGLHGTALPRQRNVDHRTRWRVPRELSVKRISGLIAFIEKLGLPAVA